MVKQVLTGLSACC